MQFYMVDLVPGVVGVARDHGDQVAYWGQEQLVHCEDGRSTHLGGTLEQHCAVSLFDGSSFCALPKIKKSLSFHLLLVGNSGTLRSEFPSREKSRGV